MTLAQVKGLQNWDEVFWTDPNDGLCSNHLLITDIHVVDGVVRIWSIDGGYLEAFPDELS